MTAHLIMSITQTFKLHLFGAAKNADAVIVLVLADFALWVWQVVTLHPIFVDRIYSGTYSDHLWRIFYIRNKALAMVLGLSAKFYAIAAWAVCFGTNHYLHNAEQMVCEWRIRINFDQTVSFAFIGT